MTEEEIVGWHHQLNGHEFEQDLGDGEGHRAWHAAVHESDMTEQLNNNKVFQRGDFRGYGGRLASQSKTPWNPPWQQLSLRLILENNFLTIKGIKVQIKGD